MPISNNESITVAVAVKAAMHAATSVHHENIDQVLVDYETAFNVIRVQLADVHNADALHVAFEYPVKIMDADATKDADGGYQAPPQVGAVQVKGPQHGPLPDWLIAAARKAGVDQVWDNRVDKDGNDMTQTKRPWFKSVAPKGEEGIPFWLPRGSK